MRALTWQSSLFSLFLWHCGIVGRCLGLPGRHVGLVRTLATWGGIHAAAADVWGVRMLQIRKLHLQHFATCQMVCPVSFMGSKIDIYIYTWGEAGGSPEDVGTFSLSLIDICIFCRSCIQMGGWGNVNVRCIASSEDVVTLKIVLAYRWGVGWR